MNYTLLTLPSELQQELLKIRTLENRDEFFAPIKDYRDAVAANAKQQAKNAKIAEKQAAIASDDIFAMMEVDLTSSIEELPSPELSHLPQGEYTERTLMLATDNYAELGLGFADSLSEDLFASIIPRSEKSKELQKRRTKEKAEVFTPSWVCNLQNNLVDNELLYENAFNIENRTTKTWTPTTGKIKFDSLLAVAEYLTKDIIEICCGEGPYLVSPYDTVTGETIPVKNNLITHTPEKITLSGRDPLIHARHLGLLNTDSEMPSANDKNLLKDTSKELDYEPLEDSIHLGLLPQRGLKFTSAYQRIGVLDRKLRVASENAENLEEYAEISLIALSHTFGYEFQGDNLILCRLNILNTMIDYYYEFGGVNPDLTYLLEVAEIISWNFWQMDGLTQALPGSCSEDCESCKKGRKQYSGHDGVLPVFKKNAKIIPFEVMLELG